jgi:uracil-DNA glycosylase family 4
MNNDLFYGTTGPRSGVEIMLVGEAWGRDEAAAKRAFVGSSGQLLNTILAEAGIDREACLATNVIASQPANNQMWRFFHPRDEYKTLIHGLHPNEFAQGELDRLWELIDLIQPKLIIAIGNYALWALTPDARISYASADDKGPMDGGGRLVPAGITDFRGSMLWSRPLLNRDISFPVLPIIHPAAIMRDWTWRSPTVHDLRTRVPMALANDWRGPPMNINIRPTLPQVEDYFYTRIGRMNQGEAIECSIDIETMAFDTMRGITCISFSTEENHALTLPFIDKRGDAFVPYWPNTRSEARAVWAMLKFISHPNFGAIGQNFLYDQSYFLDHYGVVPKLSFDTMLAHHLVWPGTPKALGYLSSLHCRYHRFWKDDNREWGTKASPDTHFLYNGEDAIRTREIAQAQRGLISSLGLDALYAEEIEKQELAFDMMTTGVKIDLKARADISMRLFEAAEEHQRLLLRLIPQGVVDYLMQKAKPSKSFWFSSPQQVQFVFYDILQMPRQTSRKSGNATTDAKALENLKDKMPGFAILFQLIENMRSIGVFTKTFIRAPLDPDGRMRCSFNTCGTETFRWSSSENPFGRGTNLQNIPSGDD